MKYCINFVFLYKRYELHEKKQHNTSHRGMKSWPLVEDSCTILLFALGLTSWNFTLFKTKKKRFDITHSKVAHLYYAVLYLCKISDFWEKQSFHLVASLKITFLCFSRDNNYINWRKTISKTSRLKVTDNIVHLHGATSDISVSQETVPEPILWTINYILLKQLYLVPANILGFSPGKLKRLMAKESAAATFAHSFYWTVSIVSFGFRLLTISISAGLVIVCSFCRWPGKTFCNK